MIRMGIDIGSTTAKLVAVDEYDKILFSKYERHHAKAKETIIHFLRELFSLLGDAGYFREDHRFNWYGDFGKMFFAFRAGSCGSNKGHTTGLSARGVHD